MEFKVISSYYKIEYGLKEIISRYNGEQINCYEAPSKENDWNIKRDIYKIDFNCLSDLVDFQNETNKEIILYSDKYGINGAVLEVNDDDNDD